MIPHTSRVLIPLCLATLSLAALIGETSVASAGQIRGRLLRASYGSDNRTAYYWEVDNGFKETGRDRFDLRRELAAVLITESVDDAGTEKGATSIELKGGSLLPSTIVARPGTTLRIRNEDQIAHELHVPGLDGFSAEATSPGALRSVSLSKAGSWPILDRLVPHARGHLHVLPGLVAVATLQDAGDFHFADVPAGSYTLRILHGAQTLVSKVVEVQERGDVLLEPIALVAPEPAPSNP